MLQSAVKLGGRRGGEAPSRRLSPLALAARPAAAGDLGAEGRSKYYPAHERGPGRRTVRGLAASAALGRPLSLLAADEGLDLRAGGLVVVLLRRRLHEVARRRQDRAADAAVLGDLRGAQGVDDDAGRV